MSAALPSLAELKAEARRRTGLDDFGDAWFEEPLAVLLDSIGREAQLSSLGAMIQGERLLTGLTNRLKIRDCINRNPDIHRMPVEVGVVIVGLGRSGSTLLQRLLAQACNSTAVYWWESLNPVPFADEIAGQPTARREVAREAVAQMLAASPDLLSIHPLDADAADEEVMLLEQSFVSSAPESFLNVPSYARWLESADQAPAYRELREVLQLLTWQDQSRIGRRWVLKTPHHLTALPTLIATFPDARIVMPHRDPVKTVVSWCSLVAALSAPNSDQLDLHRIGAHWSARLQRNLDGFIRARDSVAAERFIDVGYQRLLRDPVAVGADILERSGMGCSTDDIAAMRNWISTNARDRRASHQYAASEFGLDEGELSMRFESYRRGFLR